MADVWEQLTAKTKEIGMYALIDMLSEWANVGVDCVGVGYDEADFVIGDYNGDEYDFQDGSEWQGEPIDYIMLTHHVDGEYGWDYLGDTAVDGFLRWLGEQ